MKRWAQPIGIFLVGAVLIAVGIALAVDAERAVRHQIENRQQAQWAAEHPGGVSISISHPTIGTPADQQKIAIGLIIFGVMSFAVAIYSAVEVGRRY